ncbi:hypothetical protein M434DRAFT_399423 [Hypoxylon sp. CO27-5]|nr:hypothetical protein M434DRAFT_399423 [Hypoxylon sp. CO27-5]
MTNETGNSAFLPHIRFVSLDAGNIQRQIGCYPICIRMSHTVGCDPVIAEHLPRIRDSDLHNTRPIKSLRYVRLGIPLPTCVIFFALICALQHWVFFFSSTSRSFAA